ncbi:EscJ/YscJ/HrcJ family type III secretion inner membrane ring protein [Serratia liquefaciens]|uniref:EscJ/YscJ/HrcJ family type III secretion inner membrane ring protein n=1 Tax=Serratia liquefaciens TaxID=614 RepID=UPI0021571F24|nr:EscJ/YscJ/HrcJ family type III secretion inner membrane ring protein [Serratia liquefaciens]
MLKAILPLFLLLLVGCKEQELLKGLDQTQANEIISLLQSNNIDVKKSEVDKQGYSISVGRLDFSTAVDLMRIYDLPSKPRLQIAEMFPSDSLISSPRAEKARLYSGIEQRLEQSLLVLKGVVAARVHVSYDLSAMEGERNKTPVHLSALVKYDAATNKASLMINDIKRFLKNSFQEVEYENISVVLSEIPQVQHLAPTPDSRGQRMSLWLLAAMAMVFAGGAAAAYLFYKRKKLKD